MNNRELVCDAVGKLDAFIITGLAGFLQQAVDRLKAADVMDHRSELPAGVAEVASLREFCRVWLAEDDKLELEPEGMNLAHLDEPQQWRTGMA